MHLEPRTLHLAPYTHTFFNYLYDKKASYFRCTRIIGRH
jgi:hypothetical protein